jgi:hypothetical protein
VNWINQFMFASLWLRYFGNVHLNIICKTARLSAKFCWMYSYVFNSAVCVLLNVMRGSLQMRPKPPADRYVVSVTISTFQTKLECIIAVYSDCRK